MINLNEQINLLKVWMMNSILFFPLSLSLISALIFWIIFSFLPFRRRKQKLRPVVELDMVYLRQHLIQYFNILMRCDRRKQTVFSKEIISGSLKLDHIILALQNKFLTDDYKKINEYMYDSVYEELLDKENMIITAIDRVYRNSQFVKAKELIILESIRNKISEYNWDKVKSTKEKLRNLEVWHSVSKDGDSKIIPPVPFMLTRSTNYYELYQLLINLQSVVNNNKYQDGVLYIQKIQSYYYTGKYKRCILTILFKNRYPEDSMLIKFYFILSLYKLGRIRLFRKKLSSLLKNIRLKHDLISSREFFKEIINNRTVYNILEEYYSSSEIEEMKSILRKEEMQRNKYINQQLGMFDNNVILDERWRNMRPKI